MKTTPLLIALLATRSLAFAVEPAKPAVCPSCCAPDKTPAGTVAAKPLTARSLYQLDATWTNDGGEKVALASLRGRPVILAMFFSSCEYACPMLIADVQRLRLSLPEEIRAQTQVVLVSFDPERDTPAALHRFRETRALDDKWTLLHGNAIAVQDLAMLLGVKYKQEPSGQFAHSNLLTILNPEGEITHQRAGLGGDVAEAARAVVLAAK